MQNTNWKTTILGVLTILGAIIAVVSKVLNNEMPSWEEIALLFALISSGGGLVKAKDAQ